MSLYVSSFYRLADEFIKYMKQTVPSRTWSFFVDPLFCTQILINLCTGHKRGDQQRMTMILMEQSVSCILYIHQPIYKKKIHINSLHTNNILVPTYCYQKLKIHAYILTLVLTNTSRNLLL